jgi:S1-C subfamily serine protease
MNTVRCAGGFSRRLHGNARHPEGEQIDVMDVVVMKIRRNLWITLAIVVAVGLLAYIAFCVMSNRSQVHEPTPTTQIVIKDEGGYILTNNRVVANADTIEVELYDGAFFLLGS